MIKTKILVSVVFAVLFILSESLSASGKQEAVNIVQPSQLNETNSSGLDQLPPFVPGVILVGLKQDVPTNIEIHRAQIVDPSLNEKFAQLGVLDISPVFLTATRLLDKSNQTSTDFGLDHIYRLHLSPDADILGVARELRDMAEVEYAEPDYKAHIIAIPNDPEYANQWGLTKINAPSAWDISTGTPDTTIAYVDAGIDSNHPDLSGRLWQNPGEIADNGIDDDNNGYVDDINGWNFVNHNTDLGDITGHGTEVAGVIAAGTDNNLGVAGLCWQCRLMVVKVVQSSGVANYSDIAAGVIYAAQKGAKVINISLGGNSDSITLKSAIAYAAQTAVIVAGAGNDNSSTPFYPAAYDDFALAVAGTTESDAKVNTSNYGDWVDISAPGENIRTTFYGSSYGDASGTSLAAPFVSGVAGLLRSSNPAWSANLVRAQIVQTTDDIDGLNPGYEGLLGEGRLNAQKALTINPKPILEFTDYSVSDYSVA